MFTMKMNKIVIFGVIALVVFGCVVAAGCTTTTTPQDTANEKIVGMWSFIYDKEGEPHYSIDIINKDGTGINIDAPYDGSFQTDSVHPFSWKKNEDGTYDIKFTSQTIKLSYDSVHDTATDSKYNAVHNRLDSVCGTWFGEGVDKDGKNVKITHIIYPEGTGSTVLSYDDGTALNAQTTWFKNSDGTYTLKFSNGDVFTLKLNDAKDILTTSSGNELKKKYTDSYFYLSLLGTWIDYTSNSVSTFNADGTGVHKTENGLEHFTWEFIDNTRFKLTHKDGERIGQNTVWSYDRENNSLITGNLSHTLVRPVSTGYGVTLITENTVNKEPWIGQWTSTIQDNAGKSIEVIATFKIDGIGSWIAMGDVNDSKLLARYSETWEKIGLNSFSVTASDGNKYFYVYEPNDDTIIEDGKLVYTRQEGIVGVWAGENSSNTAKTTTILKNDGTGLIARAYTDGTSKIDNFTWKKLSDNTYAVSLNNGDNLIFRLSEDQKRVIATTTASDKLLILKKKFINSFYPMEIPGIWYNKKMNRSFVINADGTGFSNIDGYVLPFTWKMNGAEKVIITYQEMEAPDEYNLSGQTYEWEYDSNLDVIKNSKGTIYIKPTDSVENIITVI